MTASYTSVWTPFATNLKTSLETIASVDSAVEGNLMANSRYTDKKGSIAFFAINNDTMSSSTNTTLKRMSIGSRVKVTVGICCLSDKPSGAWLAENHWNLVDWFKDLWTSGSTFTGTCLGWNLLTEPADRDGSMPFVFATMEINFA